ncbi:hypothetical protein [Janthinobacterium fluminis]|uniref:STAS domain-containing protein n=1 Tax=Janthinobacterium fluminis TaxID=2987524 RepID=A0ABT5JXM0_9BURK|nr:hypothetical protein [Janthinobacterium fluminis]MDC8757490.1 hypothetical protein [Janthinobacterium fluminis]
MESSLKAAGTVSLREADIPMTSPGNASCAGHSSLAQCVVPVAHTCLLLQASGEVDIGGLTDYLHTVAKTYHAYGAANLTFIVSDLRRLQLGGFFSLENQRKLVGNLPIELRYLFASEEGAFHFGGPLHAVSYWGKYFAKKSALPKAS